MLINRKLFTFFRQLLTQSIPVACPERIEVRIQFSLESKIFTISAACSRPVHPSVVMKTTKLVTREGERLLPQEDLLQVRLIFVWSLHLHIVLLQE